MMRYERSKSSIFLLEILINILLFSVLCVCSLQFFTKSYQLTSSTTTLHHAVTACNNVAAVFQSGDGSLEPIESIFSQSFTDGGDLYIYLDENYQECDSQKVAYYIVITQQYTSIPSINVAFYKNGEPMTYNIDVYCYQPIAPADIHAIGGGSNE